MTIQTLKSKITDLEAKREVLIKKKKPIEAALTRCYNQIKKLTEELSLEELKTKSDDLSYLLSPETWVTDANYRARDIWARKHGVSFQGHYLETKQPACQISLKKGQDITNLMETINRIIPHYIPIEGAVIFQIMEVTLSEYGVFTLRVSPDSKTAKIIKTVYGTDHTVFSGTLSDALTKIADEYWYD